jgi:hypothetical protein
MGEFGVYSRRKHGVSQPMRYARMILIAIVFTASFGLAAPSPTPQAAPAEHITVISKSHMEIMSNGQFSGKISLAVGTQLDVDGVDGEFVLVHIHMMHGRVPAKDTDIGGGAPVAMDAARPTAQPAAQASQARVPQPAATQSLAQAARPAAAAPTSAPRSMVMVPQGEARPRLDAGAARLGTGVFAAVMMASVVLLVGYWRLFTKAGKPGWAILVPIYNMIVIQQIAGKPTWWIVLMFVPFVNIVISIICVFAIARNFGKGTGFGFGLLFLPWIFIPVLAFGDAAYVGSAG